MSLNCHRKLLSQFDKTVEDMDLIGSNETVAAVPLVSLKILSKDDSDKFKELQEKNERKRGAIASGYPVGASGARITMTLMYELMRRGFGLGVAAICEGLSQREAIMMRV